MKKSAIKELGEAGDHSQRLLKVMRGDIRRFRMKEKSETSLWGDYLFFSSSL
jgi:hypothetical protein